MKRLTRISLHRRIGAVAIPALFAAGALGAPQASEAALAVTGLHVEGNKLVNGNGETIRLVGVNRSGSEYACIQGWGIFDGPADDASIKAIASWKANAVRVLLNEQCWLQDNPSNPYDGATYRNAIVNYVNLISQNGLVPIVDLHWTAPNGQTANDLDPMPNRDNTPTFWTQVANTFKSNSAVVFDLYNEPYPDNNQNTFEAWRCWRDGGTCAGVGYTAAGMQELVNAVRATGAKNPIMLTGIQYGAGLSRWLEFKPSDPVNGLIASWHMYPFSWYANDQNYWDTVVANVSSNVPLVAGEIGNTDCGSDFLKKIMTWLDGKNAGYNAWVWTAWGNCEALITDYSGTPTTYGQAYKDHLATLSTTTPTDPTDPTDPTEETVVAPSNLTAKRVAKGKNQRVELSWADNSNNESEFVVERSTNSSFTSNVVAFQLGANTTSYSDKSIAGKTTYYYRVWAASSSGAVSNYSNVVSVATQ